LSHSCTVCEADCRRFGGWYCILLQKKNEEPISWDVYCQLPNGPCGLHTLRKDTDPVRPETSYILSFVTLLSEVDVPFTYRN